MANVRFYRTCGFCSGAGRVAIDGAYLETLHMLRKCGESTGAQLCKVAGCRPTAMNNRLAALERLGLVVSRRYGRLRLYKVK